MPSFRNRCRKRQRNMLTGMNRLRALYGLYVRGARTPEPVLSFISAIPGRIVYSVRDKSRQLLDRLRKGPASLEALYAACCSRSEIVATFVSILELCSLGNVYIHRPDGVWTVEFSGGNVDEIMEKIIE